jgi:hypothetical protein
MGTIEWDQAGTVARLRAAAEAAPAEASKRIIIDIARAID